ncbi:unnamed protein product [Meganyctiphanes norvegica]|uniref:m7GpppX diphosphatase n=1 Tax=Meganyctiphanes norvegica TaxID=48144 RepID=A0AAV2PY36_MEGNR
MAEADTGNAISPNKKMKLEVKSAECTVDSTTSEKNGNGTNTDVLFSTFRDFEIIRVLNNSEDHKSVAVEGRLAGKEGRAVVMLQKEPFNSDKLQQIFSEQTKLKLLFQNDVYYNKLATLPPELNEIKTTVIFPAEEKHIKRYEAHPSTFINETSQMYNDITKPFVESQSFSKQWIYNILEHKKEVERIVFEDSDPETGFILLPDLKWTGEQLENLYLQALVKRRDISCIRELTGEHLPLLQNIQEKGTTAITEKYGLPANKMRIYLHYQPSFYHLHVHFTALSFEAPGTYAGKAHLLSDIISNLEIDGDYYKKATISYTVKDNHPLRAVLQP